jgi:hypothetical protein
MKHNITRSLTVWLALCCAILFATASLTSAQGSTGCFDAAGGPIPCTATPQPTQPTRATDVPQQPQQPQPTAMPTSTPLPTAVPLIPMPTTGPCVVASSGAERINVRETPSTNGTILGSILINSTVPAAGIVEMDEIFWVITPLGFISESALRFGGEDCAQLAKVTLPTSTGPFVLRQDTDGDGTDDVQYLQYKLKDVLVSSATGETAETTGFDPDDTLIFWPPFEPAEPVGLLLPAVQKVREAAARLGDGCGDTTVFNPTTGVPGCVFGGSDILIFCTMQYCAGQQSANPQGIDLDTLIRTIYLPPNEPQPLTPAFMKLGDVKGESTDSTVPLIPELIFVPRPPTNDDGSTSGEGIECADAGISVGPFSIGGCLLLSANIAAFCISDICVYHEW